MKPLEESASSGKFFKHFDHRNNRFIIFCREARQGRGEPQQNPICNLNISLPEEINPEPGNVSDQELLAIQSKYSFLREAGYGKFDTIHRADLR